MFYALLGSSLNNLGKGVQKHGLQLKQRRVFAAGLILDAIGAVFVLFSLSLAPVSLVQPVCGGAIVVLSIYSHFVLHENLSALEWFGVLLISLGVIGIAASSSSSPSTSSSSIPSPLIDGGNENVISGGGYVLFLYLISALALLEYLHHRPRQLLYIEEFAFGCQSGICFGLSAGVGRAAMVANHQIVGVFLSLSMSLSGLYFQTRGMKKGRAVIICAIAGFFSIFTGLLIGVIALNEEFPSGRLEYHFRWVSIVEIFVGIALMNSRKGADEEEDHDEA